MSDRRLFVDMDGTLARFVPVDTIEKLYEKGYFYNLEPQAEVINSVRDAAVSGDIEVYILSSYLSDSKYALIEKNAWINTHIPEIDERHRLFVPCGTSKRIWLQEEGFSLGENDYLLDDYSKNLHEWEPPCRGIKIMNGINGNYGTWKGLKCGFEDVQMMLEEIRSGASIDEIEHIQSDSYKPEENKKRRAKCR